MLVIRIRKPAGEPGKKEIRQVALTRITGLFQLAMETGDPTLSRRYLGIMEAIAKRMDITLPANIKRSYCKKCLTLYGTDSMVRLNNGLIVLTCQNCNNVRRIPYR